MAMEARKGLQRRRPLRVDLSLRRVRPRNDTEHLLGSPEMAARLKRALEDSLTGRTHELTMNELYARYGRGPEA